MKNIIMTIALCSFLFSCANGPVEHESIKAELPVTSITFSYNSTEVEESELPEINKTLSALMDLKDDYFIILEGHTDSEGENVYNESLALQRAENVKEILMGRGIDEAKIKTVSYGEENLIDVTSFTKKNQRINRRVVIEIVRLEKGNNIVSN